MSVAMKGKSAAPRSAELGSKAKSKAVKASARRERRGKDEDDGEQDCGEPTRSFIVLGKHNPIVYTVAYKQAFNVPNQMAGCDGVLALTHEGPRGEVGDDLIIASITVNADVMLNVGAHGINRVQLHKVCVDGQLNIMALYNDVVFVVRASDEHDVQTRDQLIGHMCLDDEIFLSINGVDRTIWRSPKVVIIPQGLYDTIVNYPDVSAGEVPRARLGGGMDVLPRA